MASNGPNGAGLQMQVVGGADSEGLVVMVRNIPPKWD